MPSFIIAMRALRLDRVLFVGCLILTGATLATTARAADSRGGAGPTAPVVAAPDVLARTAGKLGAEIDALRRRSISIASAMQQNEAALSLLESRLASLTAAEARIDADLKLHLKNRRDLLMALVGLARHRPETLALSAQDPVELERSALVIGRTLPPLDRAAKRLGRDLTRLSTLKEAIAAAEERHRAVEKSLDVQQFQLAAVISRRSALRYRAAPNTAGQAKAMTVLTTEATSLKELLDRLNDEERAAPSPSASPKGANPVATSAPPRNSATPPAQKVAAPAVAVPHLRRFDLARGKVLVPASGRLVERFGKAGEFGTAAKGLTYATRPGAQVVAPYDGRILFAGPFRGYGQILIIAHGDGYDSLLAGLARLDVAVGQWLVAGEPVGTMPKSGDTSRLYLELRHGGRPINPLPWLATPNEKVSG
jgi:murein hydrolase activator